MTSFSIAGLSSGIDTTSVITQLMTIAAGPQTALKSQLTRVQQELGAYQTINTKMAAVQTAAATLAQASTWGATTATSSDATIAATGSPTAIAGTATTFSVTQIARAQTSTLALADPTNAATAANGIDLTIGSTTTHLSLSGNSASAVASAINSAGLGVKASLVNTSSGQILQFSSTSTGAANSFSIAGLSGTPQTMTAAQDASITVGDPTSGGYVVNSSTNTFANAIPGVTFTVSKLTTDATISVASNTASITSAMSSLFAAANDALTNVNAATAQGAILAGNRDINNLGQSMLSVVSSGTAGKSYSTIGVGLTSTGALTFDAAAFAAAYANDPVGTQALAQTALSAGFTSVASAATDVSTGTLTQLVSSDTNQISSLNKQISTWDTRLADQKASLEAKYAAMESALSKLKSQSSYLTSVFNSLNNTSSSSTSSSSSN